MNRLIRKKELLNITGLSIASIYRLIKKGEFPKQVRISENSIAWRESDINEWLDSRAEVTANEN